MKDKCKGLYKAKTLDGYWALGYYVKSKYYNDKEVDFIIDADSNYDDYDGFAFIDKIDPNTLCAFTGKYDVKGNMIFESDILKVSCYECKSDDEGNYEKTYTTIVGTLDDAFNVDVLDQDYDQTPLAWLEEVYDCDCMIEIIGNKYD